MSGADQQVQGQQGRADRVRARRHGRRALHPDAEPRPARQQGRRRATKDLSHRTSASAGSRAKTTKKRTAWRATSPRSGRCIRTRWRRQKSAWESAETEGMPDAPAALETVDGLADAVTQNRTALMALTAMRNYDNYTFTHMVNVSILAMAQARALGIDGKAAARIRHVGVDARHRQGAHAEGDSQQARQADRRGVRRSCGGTSSMAPRSCAARRRCRSSRPSSRSSITCGSTARAIRGRRSATR